MATTTANGAKPADVKLRFSVDSITVGDMEDLEEITGLSMGDILELLSRADESSVMKVPIKLLKALVFIIYRQADPAFTLDDARKVKVTELELVLNESPDPTTAAG